MPFIAIHWSFSLYFGWQTYFWKQGCKAESQHCSPFTQAEHTNASSPLLFLQKLECLSFLLLIPLSGLFDSYYSKIPLQKIFSLSAMAFSFAHKALQSYRQIYLLVLSPPSPKYFFSLAFSSRTWVFSHIDAIPVFWHLLSRLCGSQKL